MTLLSFNFVFWYCCGSLTFFEILILELKQILLRLLLQFLFVLVFIIVISNREDLILSCTLSACRTLKGLLEPSLPARKTCDMPTFCLIQVLIFVANTTLESSTLTKLACWSFFSSFRSLGLQILNSGFGKRITSTWLCFARLQMTAYQVHIAILMALLNLLT